MLSVDTIIVWEDGSQTPLAQVIRQLGKGTITQILIPIGITNRKIGKSQVALTPKDKPIVGCYASITFDNKKVIKANLVLTGASKNKLMISESINKIIGSDFTTEMIRSVADKVVETSDPPDDYRGSSDYRLEMARVTTIRALNECLTGDKNL